VPFLFLMDGPYLLVVGTHWGTAFALGIWAVSAPQFAMTALVVLVAMAFAAPPSDHVASSDLFRKVSWICAILAVLLVVIALLTAGLYYWLMIKITFNTTGNVSPIWVPMRAGSYAQLLKPFVCTAFCAALAAMALMSRRESSGNISSGGAPGGDPIPGSPSAPMNAGPVSFGKR
jgi:hypothetical protein